MVLLSYEILTSYQSESDIFTKKKKSESDIKIIKLVYDKPINPTHVNMTKSRQFCPRQTRK